MKSEILAENPHIELYEGDCLEILPSFPDKSFDLCLTDPPYGINLKSSWTDSFEKITNDDSLQWVAEFFQILDGKTKEESSFYVYTGYGSYPEFYKHLSRFAKIRNWITVPKTQLGGNPSFDYSFASQMEFIIFATKGMPKFRQTKILKPSSRYLKDVRKKDVPEYIKRLPDYWHWCKAGVWNNARRHPTEKDISAPMTAIKCSSDKGDTILDPFAGSGTTGEAAFKLNRNCTMIEIAPKYCDIIRKRIDVLARQERLFK